MLRFQSTERVKETDCRVALFAVQNARHLFACRANRRRFTLINDCPNGPLQLLKPSSHNKLQL